MCALQLRLLMWPERHLYTEHGCNSFVLEMCVCVPQNKTPSMMMTLASISFGLATSYLFCTNGFHCILLLLLVRWKVQMNAALLFLRWEWKGLSFERYVKIYSSCIVGLCRSPFHRYFLDGGGSSLKGLE